MPTTSPRPEHAGLEDVEPGYGNRIDREKGLQRAHADVLNPFHGRGREHPAVRRHLADAPDKVQPFGKSLAFDGLVAVAQGDEAEDQGGGAGEGAEQEDGAEIVQISCGPGAQAWEKHVSANGRAQEGADDAH